MRNCGRSGNGGEKMSRGLARAHPNLNLLDTNNTTASSLALPAPKLNIH